jgi:AbiV family abortive infection protein
MSCSIPYNELEEGLRIILRNVNSLIDTASLLYNNKEFLHSAIFSITAIEEMAKAHLLKANCNDRKDVPITQWDRITRGTRGRSAHLAKITDFVKALPLGVDDIRKHPGVLADTIIELIARYHVRLKLHVLYVDWDKRLGKWQWFPEQYSEKEQEEVSARLLNAARKGYEKYQVA